MTPLALNSPAAQTTDRWHQLKQKPYETDYSIFGIDDTNDC